MRLGGIYALERIARDSPGDRATIGEVLTAYLRGRAPWPPRLEGQPPVEAAIETVAFLRLRAPDVQAALTVLGRGRFADPTRRRRSSTWRTPTCGGRASTTPTCGARR